MPAPGCDYGRGVTLEMLDLQYDATAKFYEAPPQMKAVGGVFIIDDFGRQLVKPRDLPTVGSFPSRKSGLSDDPYRQEI